MDCSRPGFTVHHQLLQLAQTPLVHWVGNAIQQSPPLSSPSPPAVNLSQHQGLFQWVSLHIRWPKYWSFTYLLNEYSYSYYILAEYTKEVAALIYSYPCFSYPLYSCTILWLSGHLFLKNFLVASTFLMIMKKRQQLWVKHTWVFVCKYIFKSTC